MHQRSSQFYHKALAYFFTLIFVTGCGKPVTNSEPRKGVSVHQGVSTHILLDVSMSTKFDMLPLRGGVRKGNKYWSGDSWRLRRGSINLRWNSPQREGFNYLSPLAWEIPTYPKEKLKQLSPAEKFDLYMGRYDYPLKWEVDLFARNGIYEWEGICHGWAGATINHEEPKPRTVTNPEGIEIYFGSSDLKALLSYAYSKILIEKDESLGRRCEEAGLIAGPCDDDLTAAEFHIVLTNMLGLREQAIIADLDRYQEVWNHPLTKYESVIEEKNGKKAIIRTKMTYVDVVEKNSWNPHPAVIGYMTVRYELEMDARGNIINGKWLSKNRPDFLWTVKKSEKFEGYLYDVLKLVR